MYYLSVPCVGCPCVSKDLKGQACLAAHSLFSIFMQFNLSLSLCHLASLSLLLILEDKGGPTPGHLNRRVSSDRWKQAFPDLPSLVKM